MNSLPAAHERLPQRRSAKAVRLRRSHRRDDERGLTTLEWLLIVAAVAGLAAVAVVVVQGVVSDTSDQIAGSGARLTTAQFEAEDITDDAIAAIPKAETATANRKTATILEEQKAEVVKLNARYEERCDRLNIAYGNAFKDVDPPQEAAWTAAIIDDHDGDTDGTDEQAPKCTVQNK